MPAPVITTTFRAFHNEFAMSWRLSEDPGWTCKVGILTKMPVWCESRSALTRHARARWPAHLLSLGIFKAQVYSTLLSKYVALMLRLRFLMPDRRVRMRVANLGLGHPLLFCCSTSFGVRVDVPRVYPQLSIDYYL